MNQMIPSSEKVARILNPEWIQDGVLMHEAYHLRVGETYISVNRPSVSSYDNDVSDFVRNHPSFSYEGDKYKRSLLGVDDIRNINVVFEGIEAHVNVEVEPRDVHYKSHAGIFIYLDNEGLQGDRIGFFKPLPANISASPFQLRVQGRLLKLARQHFVRLT